MVRKMYLPEEQKKKLSKAIANMSEVKFAYLYGSYATGLANEDSDIDIAIMLKEDQVTKQSLMSEIEISLLLEEIINNEKEIDVHFLNDAPIYFLNEAVTKGIPLFAASEPERNTFEARVIMEYLDFKPVYDLYDSYRLQRTKRGEFGVKYRRNKPKIG